MALLLFILAMSCSAYRLQAQVATNYMFSQSVGTYTPITGGTVVASYTGTSGAPSMDDVTYTLPAGTIPFTFNFDGTGYTGLHINSNGFIAFGATAPANATYTPLSSTTAYAGAISAHGRDLQGGYVTAADRTLGSDVLTNVTNTAGLQIGDFLSGTGIPANATVISFTANTITMSLNATSTGTNTGVQYGGPSSNIRVQTIGNAPNRIFVVQFSRFKRFGTALTTTQHLEINFQIRLHETSNNIEIVYGNNTPGLTTLTSIHQAGLRGPNNTFATNVNGRMNTKGVNDNWLNSVPATANSSGLLFNNVAPANIIPTGLTYTWFTGPPPPPPVPANDLCANATAITCGSSTSGSTVSATTDSAPLCVTTNTAPGVWYTIVGDGDVFTMSLCASTYDTKISVYTGTCGALVCETGNDDFCSLQSQVQFQSVAGTTYYVLVHGFSAATGDFTLDVSCAPLCPAPIAAPWSVASINAAGGAGLEDCDGTYDVSATGTGTTTADKLTFVYQSLSGNGYITAKINSIQPFVYGGVQFRDGLSAGARKAGIATQLGSRAAREFRNVSGAAHSTAQLAAPKHQWVRAARNGDVFSLSVSPNGVNWTMLSQVTMTSAPASMNVGFYVFSQLTSLGEINFSDVTITSGLPVAQDISSRNAAGVEFNAIQAFPNPAKSELNINMSHLEGGAAAITLMNNLGKVVLHQEFDNVNQTERLDVSKLSSGLYFLQVNQEAIIKVVIE